MAHATLKRRKICPWVFQFARRDEGRSSLHFSNNLVFLLLNGLHLIDYFSRPVRPEMKMFEGFCVESIRDSKIFKVQS